MRRPCSATTIRKRSYRTSYFTYEVVTICFICEIWSNLFFLQSLDWTLRLKKTRFKTKPCKWFPLVFTTRCVCIAWTMLSEDVRMPVRPSVRLVHGGIVSKQLNISKLFTFHIMGTTILRRNLPPNGASNAGGMKQITTFSRYLSKIARWGPKLLWKANRNSYAWCCLQWPWAT